MCQSATSRAEVDELAQHRGCTHRPSERRNKRASLCNLPGINGSESSRTRLSSSGMAVVLDPEFGDRISALAQTGPVWIVDTPVVRAAAQAARE
jgi:hypothetical protein